METALSPANEPICLARKPISEYSVARNVIAHGTGALNIASCRIATSDSEEGRKPSNVIVDQDAAGILASQGGTPKFYFCPKASRQEKGDGNIHISVKPVDLMRYLVKLVTPPDGVILDPFLGTGTTGVAAKLEGFNFIGIDQDPKFVKIARRRIRETESSP